MPGFDVKSAQRIVRAVKTVERMGGGGIVRRGKHDVSSGVLASRWKATKTDTLEMTIGDGSVTRNNHTVNWSEGTKTLASGTATHYLYFELDESTTTKDPSLEPDQFAGNEIKSSTTYPSDDYNKIIVVCKVEVEDDEIVSWEQLLFSDVDDWCDTPDKDVQSSHPSETLERNANGGWQLVDADETASRDKYAKLNSSNQLTWATIEATTDELVAVDSEATAGYLGAGNSEGVLQCDGATIQKTDGGNFITLSVIMDAAGGVASNSRGVPSGGSQYQALVKNSATNYDIKWDWIRAH